jgi:hypothetical protein
MVDALKRVVFNLYRSFCDFVSPRQAFKDEKTNKLFINESFEHQDI